MSWRLEDRIVARLDEAISETQRFLKRARAAKKALKDGDGTRHRCHEFAAAKRASLDLARSVDALQPSSCSGKALGLSAVGPVGQESVDRRNSGRLRPGTGGLLNDR